MRRSGESKASEDETVADASRKPHSEDSESGEPTPARRSYSAWLKAEKPKLRVALPPPNLSQRNWTRLSRQIAAYLRRRLNNTVTLRSLVRTVAAEMQLAGARPDEVAAALRRAVLEHPDLPRLDRTNVVTRRLASDELLDLMLDWVRKLDLPTPDE